MDGTGTAPRMDRLAWAMLFALSVVWGGSFFFQEVAVAALPPLTIVLARVALAAVTLWAVLAVTGARLPRGGAVWVAFFVMGFLNNVVPFALIVWGQQTLASGVAAILNAMTPVFTVIAAHLLTADERLTPGKLAGCAFGFSGVAVMMGPEAISGLGAGGIAQLAVLAAALSYALAGLYGRRFRAMGLTPLATAAGQVTASSAMLLPLVVLVDRPWTLPVPGLPVLLALAGLAMLSTALAYILYFGILARAGATNLLLVTLLIPVSAAALGILVLGERLTAADLAGMGFIALALVAIDGRAVALIGCRGAA